MGGKLAKNLIYVSASQLLIIVAKSFLIIILGRTLGASGYGIYTLQIIAPILISTLVALGVSRSITFNLSSSYFTKRLIFGNHFFLVLGLSIVVMSTQTILFVTFRGSIFKELAVSNMVISLLIGFLATLQILNNGIIHGLQAFQRLPNMTFCQWIGNLILVGIFFVSNKLNAFTAAISFASGLLIYGSLSLTLPDMRRILLIKKMESSYIKACLGFGSKASIHNLSNIINLRLDFFVVKYFLSTSALGYYALATSACEVFLSLFSRGLDIVLLPWVARQSGDVRDAGVAIVLRFTLWFMLIIAGFLILFGHYVIVLLFGENFAMTAICLNYLLPGLVALSITYSLTGVLMGKNQLDILIIGGVLSLSLTIALDIALIPIIGIKGAAVASSAAYIFQGIILFIYNYKKNPIPLSNYLFFKKNDVVIVRNFLVPNFYNDKGNRQ